MTDPLAEVVTLLQPSAPLSKLVSGAGAWRVHRLESGQPFYCMVLEGSSRLTIEGQEPIELRESDFVLIPAAYGFTMSSLEPETSGGIDPFGVRQMAGEVRHGNPDGPPNARLLVGHFAFGSPDAPLLVSLLPQFIHVHGEARFATIVQLVGDEARALRPARDMILAHLMEVLLVEALRSTAGTKAPPGLLRGLADTRLAAAIRLMHENPTRDWTVEQLAKGAALSRSAFFERFRRAMGVAPMEYLLSWRMALAKNLLRRNEGGMKEIADRVGYGSASAFSVAFTRFVGVAPTRYLQEVAPS
ncbi:AraC family transcriptional regulator, partial [Rhizobium favelukesii]|uniref:AraC family transcriptional regulator n=2 Tax=Rhizobium/Agrobacterium group TaxID=227290 RepID=W6RNL7_9HYPH